jgi:hypothetical protein
MAAALSANAHAAAIGTAIIGYGGVGSAGRVFGRERGLEAGNRGAERPARTLF